MTSEPKYPLQEQDRKLVEEVLALAQRLVDLQYDDETADELQSILTDTADMFGIECQEVQVTVDEDGTITARALESEQPLPDTRRGLKLVSDNGNITPIRAELPEGFALEPDKPRSGPTPENED